MGRHPAVYLMGRGAIPSRRGFSRGAMRHPGVSGITRPFGRLSRGRGQVLHVLLSRSPLASLRRGVPFDLHVLGAPPAFVLSQDQTLYKWYLITYKVLNRCNHSDTIACVLYELLVNLELINVGFQTHDQGSTSFSFVQFSRSCCAVAFP